MSDARPTINSYRDLVVWQEAMDVAVEAYRVTARFPKEETYGLISQIRRSGVSVPANIAEGYGRDSKGSYIQLLRVAQGSLKELETLLLLSERVTIAKTNVVDPLLVQAEKVGKMLRSLIRSLENSG